MMLGRSDLISSEVVQEKIKRKQKANTANLNRDFI